MYLGIWTKFRLMPSVVIHGKIVLYYYIHFLNVKYVGFFLQDFDIRLEINIYT